MCKSGYYHIASYVIIMHRGVGRGFKNPLSFSSYTVVTDVKILSLGTYLY